MKKNKSGKGKNVVLGTRVKVIEIFGRVARGDLEETVTSVKSWRK